MVALQPTIGLAADFEFKKPKYMTKVEFTNWLHTEFDAVFHGDITPEQVMLNAIPMINLFVSKNCGKPLVSGSLPNFTKDEIRDKAEKHLAIDGTENMQQMLEQGAFNAGAIWMYQLLGGNDR